jgi:hypothetical protein
MTRSGRNSSHKGGDQSQAGHEPQRTPIPPPVEDTQTKNASRRRKPLADHEGSRLPGVSDRPTQSGYDEKQGDAHGNTRKGAPTPR